MQIDYDFYPALEILKKLPSITVHHISKNNYYMSDPISKETVGEIRRNFFHSFDKELRQPASLQEQARRVINECVTIHRVSRLSELNLPKVLEKKLRDFIEIDCFWCFETISKSEEELEKLPINEHSIFTFVQWNNEEQPPKLQSREI